MITVNGKRYKVVENMGFVHSRGVYAKVIDFNGEEQVVIKIGNSWEIAKPIIEPVSYCTGQ